MRTSLIVAADEQDNIGVAGGLPWHLPADLRRFKQITLGHALVVGRRTHDGIVARLNRPLPGRFSVVVSSTNPGVRRGQSAIYQPDADAALDLAHEIEAFAGRDEVFVIGGAQVYAALLPRVDRVYLTRVHLHSEGDAAMPANWLDGFTAIAREECAEDARLSFLTFERG